MSTHLHLATGSVLQGKYRIEKILGQGGFGITYLALHQILHKKVAVKELFLNLQGHSCSRSEHDGRTVRPHFADFPKFKERFMAEARTLAKFTGKPGIVQVSEMFEENDTVYFIMDFVEGAALSNVVKQKGKLTEQEATDYGLQILRALKEVHAEGILHRDIKPDNLIVGQGGRITLIDFGIAREYTENETQTQTAMHSVGYAPPEQRLNNARRSASMDLYGVGAVLYYCLTGQRPQTTDEIAMDGYVAAAALNPRISGAMNAIINKALEKPPAKRYQSAEEMMAVLGGKAQEATIIEPPSAPHITVLPPKPPPAKVGDKWWIGAGLLAVAALLLWWLWPSSGGEATQTTSESTPAAVDTAAIISAQKTKEEAEARLREAEEAALAEQRRKEEEERKRLAAEEAAKRDPFEGQMVRIGGGSFEMGDVMGDNEESDEKPIHTVTLSSYSISKYEVTQAQWRAVMGNNPSNFKGCDQCPVEQVSWDDVQQFLRKLNAITGKQYRLPTEAEWEYAARERGKRVRFGNGKDIADPSEINFYGGANSKKSYSVLGVYREKTMPVGSFRPNALGLYDMSGNVWEWCSGWFGTYPSTAQTNPRGPSSGSDRVYRGGGWFGGPQYARVANRNYNNPEFRNSYLGFRLAVGL